MRRLLLLLLLCSSAVVFAQPELQLYRTLKLGKDNHVPDSILEKDWRYSSGDSMLWIDSAFDDSKWTLVASNMDSARNDTPYYRNYDIGWFRLHFNVDSNMLNVPLALSVTHLGASEIYLDGRKLSSYGKILGKDSSDYVSPANDPAFFVLTHCGPHLLSIRYANYDADRNYRVYHTRVVGFRLKIMTAQAFGQGTYGELVAITFILILMFGIFLALSISHVFLYLYNRTIRSNLFFSLFCLGIGLLFYVFWLASGSAEPTLQLSTYYTIPSLISLICFSLSGFVNELFATKTFRFKVIAISCIALPVLIWILDDRSGGSIGTVGLYILGMVVVLETIILIVKAMLRKVRGAKIIGVGLLSFSLFLFVTLIFLGYAATSRSLLFDGDSIGMILFLVFGVLSFLSLPVSMSLFLAWNFAHINKELKKNLQQVEELSAKTIAQELERTRMIENRKEELEQEVTARTAEVVAQKEQLELQHSELKTEKKRSDDLLLNILPGEVAEELKTTGHSDARLFNDVSVMFTDFVDFTKAGERMSPQELVDELHICFRTFDEIISKYGIEKIKTIGDAYLAVSGLPVADPDHAVKVTKAAREILAFMKERRAQMPHSSFEIRIGIHSGSVVAGIVGIKKFAYDIWGDTVNTAARMESSSEPGRINISATTHALVKDTFRCTHRGMIAARNKGEMDMYFVEGEN